MQHQFSKSEVLSIYANLTAYCKKIGDKALIESMGKLDMKKCDIVIKALHKQRVFNELQLRKIKKVMKIGRYIYSAVKNYLEVKC